MRHGDGLPARRFDFGGLRAGRRACLGAAGRGQLLCAGRRTYPQPHRRQTRNAGRFGRRDPPDADAGSRARGGPVRGADPRTGGRGPRDLGPLRTHSGRGMGVRPRRRAEDPSGEAGHDARESAGPGRRGDPVGQLQHRRELSGRDHAADILVHPGRLLRSLQAVLRHDGRGAVHDRRQRRRVRDARPHPGPRLLQSAELVQGPHAPARIRPERAVHGAHDGREGAAPGQTVHPPLPPQSASAPGLDRVHHAEKPVHAGKTDPGVHGPFRARGRADGTARFRPGRIRGADAGLPYARNRVPARVAAAAYQRLLRHDLLRHARKTAEPLAPGRGRRAVQQPARGRGRHHLGGTRHAPAEARGSGRAGSRGESGPGAL